MVVCILSGMNGASSLSTEEGGECSQQSWIVCDSTVVDGDLLMTCKDIKHESVISSFVDVEIVT
jgi:hypothetical protein